MLTLDAARRTITATLPPVPGNLLIYGEADFAAACADTMEDHAERVLAILGDDPIVTLQAMLDGAKLPAPPQRVPREIPNWRAKDVLNTQGLLSQVEAFFATLPEPLRTRALFAWNGDAKVARRSATIQALTSALGWTDAQVDAMFIAAEAIQI